MRQILEKKETRQFDELQEGDLEAVKQIYQLKEDDEWQDDEK